MILIYIIVYNTNIDKLISQLLILTYNLLSGKNKTMKFNRPIEGDERIVRRFLIIPRTIGNQTKWGEFVKIRQRYKTAISMGDGGHFVPQLMWVDEDWV